MNGNASCRADVHPIKPFETGRDRAARLPGLVFVLHAPREAARDFPKRIVLAKVIDGVGQSAFFAARKAIGKRDGVTWLAEAAGRRRTLSTNPV